MGRVDELMNMLPRDQGDIVTVTDPYLIKAAWGKRRLSSRNRGLDKMASAYPADLTAAKGLWRIWFEDTLRNPHREHIVIYKKKAIKRIEDALSHVDVSEPSTPSMPDHEAKEMIDEMERLRAAREFDKSDAIRDRLVSAGVDIKNKSVSGAA